MRKSLITLFLCTAILMSGCQSNSTPETELSESANNTDVYNEDTSESESQETVSEPDDEPLTVDEIPEPVSVEHPAFPDNEREELPDFTGMAISENAEEAVLLNNKASRPIYKPICFGSDNNVYFSNPKDRQSLYVYDGEASKCLVKLPVHDLQYYNDSIYFISSGKTVSIEMETEYAGFLYKYDTKSKELIRLTDFFITPQLYVGDEGIIYRGEDDTEGYLTVYKLDEASAEITPLYIGGSILYYNGYRIIGGTKYDETNDEKINQTGLSDGENSFCLITNTTVYDLPEMICIANEKLYYKQQGNPYSLTSVDLNDGTVFQFPIPKKCSIPDYTVFDGVEYVVVNSDDDWQRLYGFRDGESIKYIPTETIRRIYSDSNGIYALIMTVTGSYDIAKLTLTDEKYDTGYGKLDEYVVKCESIA